MRAPFLMQSLQLLPLFRIQDPIEFDEGFGPHSGKVSESGGFVLRQLPHFRGRFTGLNGRLDGFALSAAVPCGRIAPLRARK